MLERISQLSLTNGHGAGDQHEAGEEREKLLAVTKKLKTEVVFLREKLGDVETKLQDNEKASDNEDLSAIKQSVEAVSRERDELLLQMEKIREENHLMLATHERLQQDEAACRQQLNETRDHLLSQGEELRRMREAWSESQAEEKIKEMVASEDGLQGLL